MSFSIYFCEVTSRWCLFGHLPDAITPAVHAAMECKQLKSVSFVPDDADSIVKLGLAFRGAVPPEIAVALQFSGFARDVDSPDWWKWKAAS